MYDRMIHEHGYSIRKLADKLGKDKGYLENRLRLADAPEEIRELVSVRKDTLSHAYELLKVTDEKKRRRLAARVASGELSLVKLREKIEGRPARAGRRRRARGEVERAAGERGPERQRTVTPTARTTLDRPAPDALRRPQRRLARPGPPPAGRRGRGARRRPPGAGRRPLDPGGRPGEPREVPDDREAQARERDRDGPERRHGEDRPPANERASRSRHRSGAGFSRSGWCLAVGLGALAHVVSGARRQRPGRGCRSRSSGRTGRGCRSPPGVVAWAASETAAPWLSGWSPLGVLAGRLRSARLLGCPSRRRPRRLLVGVRGGGRRRARSYPRRRRPASRPVDAADGIDGGGVGGGERGAGRQSQDGDGDEEARGAWLRESVHDGRPPLINDSPATNPLREGSRSLGAWPPDATAHATHRPTPTPTAATPIASTSQARSRRSGSRPRPRRRRRAAAPAPRRRPAATRPADAPSSQRRHDGDHERSPTTSTAWTAHARCGPSAVAIDATPRPDRARRRRGRWRSRGPRRPRRRPGRGPRRPPAGSRSRRSQANTGRIGIPTANGSHDQAVPLSRRS